MYTVHVPTDYLYTVVVQNTNTVIECTVHVRHLDISVFKGSQEWSDTSVIRGLCEEGEVREVVQREREKKG